MSSNTPCTLTLPDGTHYDLSSLSSSKSDYTAENTASIWPERTYKLNVCREVVSELWNVGDEQGEEIEGFYNGIEGDISIGSKSTNLTLSPTNEPMLILENGGECSTGDSITTAIRFICSPSDYHAGTPKLVAALPRGDEPCSYFFEWSTHVACPTNQKASELEASHYIAFIVILGIAFLTWFGGHTLYNRLYLKRRGLDQFPIPTTLPSLHLPSFRLPSLRSNSTTSSSAQPSRPTWGSWNRRSHRDGGAGYGRIRAEENDEEEGFAARFSLDDEEDDDGQGMEDARALGGEVDAWRGHTAGGSAGKNATAGQVGSVGVHQGLVDL